MSYLDKKNKQQDKIDALQTKLERGTITKNEQKKLNAMRRENLKNSRQQGGMGNVFYGADLEEGRDKSHLYPNKVNKNNHNDMNLGLRPGKNYYSKHNGDKEKDRGGNRIIPKKNKKSVLGKIVGVFKKKGYVDHPVYGRLRY